ncbi:WW domain-binding protein 2-like isoform X2 [Varroa jacobsoni]|uniref:WW domain-binding protein 2-like isoform X2 n=1 Tax=Varroa jacobsoni TaxID=62625 RepID=UPI000BF52443|nr:WW domain-binding protein 2-like isoform X2 [Varroa jacobsoni]
MSLNTSHAANGVLLYAGEFILLYCDGVTLSFECVEPLMKGTRKGRIYLTTHRMIFRSNDDSKGLVSFSFPFYTIHDLGLEQPVFGANYIKGKVKAEPGGNWTGAANFKLTFKDGGAIEYGQALIAAVQATSRSDGLLCTVIEKWCLGTGGPAFAARAFYVVVPHAKPDSQNSNHSGRRSNQGGRPQALPHAGGMYSHPGMYPPHSYSSHNIYPMAYNYGTTASHPGMPPLHPTRPYPGYISNHRCCYH